jgi:putative autotransporter adhesin-like protein
MRTLHLLAITQLFALVLAMPAPVVAQTAVSLAPFESVELRNGGEVILRHGPTQRVTLLKGSLDYTSVTIADGGRLIINRCKSRCPKGYELEIEIVTPDITGISVADGGTIQSRGNFPRQAKIGAAVRDGGTIDIRSMAADSVTASVEEGGVILTMPQTALFARVFDGGKITYWGDARVESSVRSGGAVTRGTAAEADKPLSELSPSLSLAPIPPVPPVPPVRNRHNLRRE